MMELKNIVKYDSPYMKESIEMISDFLSELDCKNEVEDLIIDQLGLFNNGHFDEQLAKHKVSEMITPSGENLMMFMSNHGINGQRAKEMVHNAYSHAISKANEHGFEAPRISDDYMCWDYYVVLAMILADFWVTTEGNLDKASMMAYEFMSDEDSDSCKVWNYFF